MRILAPFLLVPWLAAPTAAADEATELAAEVTQGDGESALRLAHIRSESGDLSGSIAATNQALKAGVHPLRVHLVRGGAYLKAAAFADAVRELFEVVVAAPHNGHAHVQLWLALRAAQLPPAIDAQRVRAALRAAGFFVADAPRRPRAPEKAQHHENEGFAHIKAGRFEDAIAAFQAAVVEDDSRPQPFRGLGIAHGRLDQAGPSVAAWRLYLALTDRHDRARRQVEHVILDSERRRGLAGDGKVQ